MKIPEIVELSSGYDKEGKLLVESGRSNLYYFDFDADGRLACFFPADITTRECVKRTLRTIQKIGKKKSAPPEGETK